MNYIITLNIGAKYSHAYTINLWHAVRRRLPDRAYRFICYTDRPQAVPNYIETAAVPFGYLNGWWSKLTLFDAPEIPKGSTVTFLDLDTLLGPDFDQLLSTPKKGKLRILKNFADTHNKPRPNSDNASCGSGIMTWQHGDFVNFTQDFLAAELTSEQPTKAFRGDQDYLFHNFSDAFEFFPESLVESYKWGQKLGAAATCFHGAPSMVEARGDNSSNVSREALVEHWAPSLDLESFRNAYEGRRAELLLTGPSLADYKQDRSMVSLGVNSILFEDGWCLDHFLIQDKGSTANPRSFARAPGRYNDFIPAVAKWFGDFGFTQGQAKHALAGFVETKTGTLKIENGFGFEDPSTAAPFSFDPPFCTRNSVAFVAVQMLVFMGVREIHVVGADLLGGRIGQPESEGHLTPVFQRLQAAWVKAEEFCKTQGVRIVMVNPVGLRGHGFIELSITKQNPIDAREKIGDLLPNDRLIVGVELGVAAGVFSESLLSNYGNLTLHGVDRWSDHHDATEMAAAKDRLSRFGERSVLHHSTFSEALDKFKNNHLDFVYIDGYAHTGQEDGQTLRDWWSKLKPGGIFSGHDYSTFWPKTKREVDRFAKEHGLMVEVTSEHETRQGPFRSWWMVKPVSSAPLPISHEEHKTTPGKGMRFHLLTPPYAATAEKYSLCAYTQKVLKWARMMAGHGYEIFHYGHPAHELPDYVQHINTITTKDWHECGLPERGNWREVFFDAQNRELQGRYNRNTAAALETNAKPKDFILHFWSGTQAAATMANLRDVQIVEPGIGYTTTFATFKVFESHAIRNHCHGLRIAKEGRDLDPWQMDTVIPNYFDSKDFQFNANPDGYFLYLGRIVRRKGLEIVVRLAIDNPWQQFVVAGQGNLKAAVPGVEIPQNIECVGYADAAKRGELMRNAKACLVPTLYNEPFGGVAVEAMLCGTPVITSNNGAFAETVDNNISGMRCWNYSEYIEAVDCAHVLNRHQVRECAERYLFEAVAPQYDSYFHWLHHLAHDPRNLWWTKGGVPCGV